MRKKLSISSNKMIIKMAARSPKTVNLEPQNQMIRNLQKSTKMISLALKSIRIINLIRMRPLETIVVCLMLSLKRN